MAPYKKKVVRKRKRSPPPVVYLKDILGVPKKKKKKKKKKVVRKRKRSPSPVIYLNDIFGKKKKKKKKVKKSKEKPYKSPYKENLTDTAIMSFYKLAIRNGLINRSVYPFTFTRFFKLQFKLKELVDENVTPFSGVTNSTLDNFFKQLCLNSYRGMYHWDKIIPKEIADEPNFIFVLNTLRHFVLIVGTPGNIAYIDPAAGKISKDQEISRFLKLCKEKGRTLSENKRQIQANNSFFCGFFCLLWGIYFDRNLNHKLVFSKRVSLKNDQICLRWLLRFVNSM
jgi:hypothetical protein